MSIYGRISVGWRRDGEKITVNVTVPPNATAVLRLPGSPDRTIFAGEHSAVIILKK
jgi:alpha-L-rhamnosidase